MANQTESNITTDHTSKEFDGYFRVILGFAAAGTIISRIHWDQINYAQLFLGIALLCYLLGAKIFTDRVRHPRWQRIIRRMSSIDAAFIGLVITAIDFNLLPTVLFITMLEYNALVSNDKQAWIRDNIGLIGGMALGLLFHQPDWVLSTNMEVSIVSLIAVMAYFVIYAIYTSRRLSQLSQTTQALEDEKRDLRLRMYKMSRYIPPPVSKAIDSGEEQSLQTERKRITAFFSDIQNFCVMSEELEAEVLTELLNEYLTEMSRIAAHFGGTIDKFMGDAVMVFFGDNDSKGAKDDCLRCAAMAIAMRRRMHMLRQKWSNRGIKHPIEIRMGINTGFCTVGTFGTANHLDYTILGTHVNLASRLESAAKPGEILISHESWALIKDHIICKDKGEIRAKGFSSPIRVYQVVNHRKDLGKHQNYFEKSLEGFSMYLDVDRIRNYDKEHIEEYLEQVKKRLIHKAIH